MDFPDDELEEIPAPVEDLDPVDRLTVRAAVAKLPARDRDLVALRYGADLTAPQIAHLLGLRTNTVEVALHRVHARLRADLAAEFRPQLHARDNPAHDAA